MQKLKRRHIRYVGIQDGSAVYRIQSRRRDGVYHYPQIRLDTGVAHCTCEHFAFTLRWRGPHRDSPDSLCVHLKRADRSLRRKEALLIPELVPGVAYAV